MSDEPDDQGQSSTKLLLRCIFGPDLEILTSVGGDLEGHGQSPHKTIGILTKAFYISGRNLVIPA